MKRVIDLEAGIAMVVTDLHGDWDAYQRYRDRFLELRANGRADYLILTGDLIHHEGPEAEDKSLEMVLDVLALKEELGEHLIYLLGNHEMPHIYSITLVKGEHLYTPRFEWDIGEHRAQIMALFNSLPFFVRTKAGVTICHAGASPEANTDAAVPTLFNFSHEQILEAAVAAMVGNERPSLRRALSKMSHQTYDEMVHEYFAVTSPDDPRYDDFLIGTIASNFHPDFDLLWAVLFTRNEEQYGIENYKIVVPAMLQAFSKDFHTQTVLVSGHMKCPKGYTQVNQHQLRIASAKHAQPRESGVYLLLDMEQKVKTAADLLPKLATVFS
jgi:hypothetical protein